MFFQGAVNFTRPMTCRYCYQSQHWESVCTASTDCRSVSAPRDRYQANCTIKEDILCLGRPKSCFSKLNTAVQSQLYSSIEGIANFDRGKPSGRTIIKVKMSIQEQ